jgi:hypothetical protein
MSPLEKRKVKLMGTIHERADPFLLRLDRMERSKGNSCSEDWSDSTELVLGGYLHQFFII